MLIDISVNHVKMIAKRLKRGLAARGIEMKLTLCQNLAARMYGFLNYRDMYFNENACFSISDLEVDANTAAACHRFHKGILTEAGFGDFADDLLDEIKPVGTYIMKALHDA
jgi:hypothetical protein